MIIFHVRRRQTFTTTTRAALWHIRLGLHTVAIPVEIDKCVVHIKNLLFRDSKLKRVEGRLSLRVLMYITWYFSENTK